MGDSHLMARVLAVTERALATGALQSIPTDCELIEDGGVSFVVRVLGSLERKAQAKKLEVLQTAATGEAPNPFLPYDEELYVQEISKTHLCLLNKFNVVENHLLIVTRAFEHQDELLNEADFAALWDCLDQIDGLGFYNGGQKAGASQRHKHLQVVPLPLAPRGASIPMAVRFDLAEDSGVASLPFRNAFVRVEPDPVRSCEHYRSLLSAVGLDPEVPSGPYNLLVTKEWMFLVPRVLEYVAGISINALGFAGSLLVKTPAELALVQEIGPMEILRRAVNDS